MSLATRSSGYMDWYQVLKRRFPRTTCFAFWGSSGLAWGEVLLEDIEAVGIGSSKRMARNYQIKVYQSINEGLLLPMDEP